MKRKLSGQITIETSIVFPIVMMIVATLVYLSFYIHDVVTIRCFMYSSVIQNAEKDFSEITRQIKTKVQKSPTFVLKTEVDCKEENAYYEIVIKANDHNKIKWLENIMGDNYVLQTIKIEKKMSKEILYGYSAIYDELEERRSE